MRDHPRGPISRMHVEPRVRPAEHPGGLVFVEEVEAHEVPEHGAAERLGQPGRYVGGPSNKLPRALVASCRTSSTPGRRRRKL